MSALCILLGASACLGDDRYQSLEGEALAGEREIDLDDCKIEDGDIGVAGLTMGLGRVTLTFEEWVEKDGEPGEYVGFSLSLRGTDRITYRVKAGGERFSGESTTWSHPRGSSGPTVSAISHIDFCDNVPGDDCNDPDGCDNDPGEGDNDPGEDCNDPDGCDNDPGEGDACQIDSDCRATEFCGEQGLCLPIVL